MPNANSSLEIPGVADAEVDGLVGRKDHKLPASSREPDWTKRILATAQVVSVVAICWISSYYIHSPTDLEVEDYWASINSSAPVEFSIDESLGEAPDTMDVTIEILYRHQAAVKYPKSRIDPPLLLVIRPLQFWVRFDKSVSINVQPSPPIRAEIDPNLIRIRLPRTPQNSNITTIKVSGVSTLGRSKGMDTYKSILVTIYGKSREEVWRKSHSHLPPSPKDP